FSAGFTDGVLITQWPKYISSPPGFSVDMHCYQNDTDYDYKYWYRQIKGEGPVLIATLIGTSESFEKGFETGFQLPDKETKKWTLKVDVKEGTDAVYLCAASLHNNNNYPAYFGSGTKLTVLELQRIISVNMGSEAHFGDGTKLTVLDPDIPKSVPSVKILNATRKESCKKKITLVCLAKDFYPDHVKVAWFVGKQEITEDVATDPHATLNSSEGYTISSRLKVSQKMWKKPTNKFTCTVSYYNGSETTEHSASVYGVAGGYDRDSYVKSSQWMKLAYGVTIAKSGLYGLIIFVFVWRKGSNGK
ncbi:M1-specific T cell receptor beta chain, partial [Danio aesculapii]|uniref:M1-specific T cell receptor beta chain n=1 Tax=Danio aesculapii TaxID=1142201 RepID=UPI0024C00455